MFSQRCVFFLMGVAFFVSIHAQGTASESSSQFLRNEPAEKTIWYGGLVAKMIFFYGQACASGESEACFNLALIYDTGDASVKDRRKAIEHYKQACGHDHAMACNHLGILLAEGQGAFQNFKTARIYFEKSCQLKEETGCKNKETAIALEK